MGRVYSVCGTRAISARGWGRVGHQADGLDGGASSPKSSESLESIVGRTSSQMNSNESSLLSILPLSVLERVCASGEGRGQREG